MQRYYGYVENVKEQDEGVPVSTVESNGFHFENEEGESELSAGGEDHDPSVPLESTEIADGMDIDS